MANSSIAGSIEKDIQTIQNTVQFLKKKDQEILNTLLKTKHLLDRQKIEDIKLTVLDYEQEDEEVSDTEIVTCSWEEKAEQLASLQTAIREEFMEILNKHEAEEDKSTNTSI